MIEQPSDNQELYLNLFPGVNVLVRHSDTDYFSDGIVWKGEVVGEKDSAVDLSLSNQVLMGTPYELIANTILPYNWYIGELGLNSKIDKQRMLNSNYYPDAPNHLGISDAIGRFINEQG